MLCHFLGPLALFVRGYAPCLWCCWLAGGNMVAYVTKRRDTREARGGLCLDEDEANYFFRQLIWAVQFCHNNHVAHRYYAALGMVLLSCTCSYPVP